MSNIGMPDLRRQPPPRSPATPDVVGEGLLARFVLITIALVFLGLFLVMPLVVVVAQAFAKGLGGVLDTLADPDAIAAIELTVTVTAIAVPANVVFGIAAAWAIAKFDFGGKSLLVTMIDLPFSVSPVVAGLSFVLLFGSQGYFGPFLEAHGIRIMFALPALVLATVFVTFPFVARELIPLMQSQGTSEEEAALTLGAGGWTIFRRITLPNIKWGLLYGVLLCNARAMGEFGAVSVVSGKIVGLTTTMPLQIDAYYNDYQSVAAFTIAGLLALLAVVTLVVKSVLEWRFGDEIAGNRRH
jgi:sulfate transport system permease protein